ncbi:MAG: hypothetical protein ABWZ79_02315 [Pedobacter agri]
MERFYINTPSLLILPKPKTSDMVSESNGTQSSGSSSGGNSGCQELYYYYGNASSGSTGCTFIGYSEGCFGSGGGGSGSNNPGGSSSGGSWGGGPYGGNTGVWTTIYVNIAFKPGTRDCLSQIGSKIIERADSTSNTMKVLIGIANYDASAAISRLAHLQNFALKIGEITVPDKVQEADGVTNIIRKNGMTDGATGEIGMNTLTLNEGTDLAITATLIHEMMHSYFVYGINYSSGDEKAKFQEVNEVLFKPEASQGVEQHNIMAERYVYSMGRLLEQVARSRGVSTSPKSNVTLLEYCTDLFWNNLRGTKGYAKCPYPARAEATGTRTKMEHLRLKHVHNEI